jgi:hypothetical protein
LLGMILIIAAVANPAPIKLSAAVSSSVCNVLEFFIKY